MTEIRLTLPLKGFSINAWTSANKRFISAAAKEWVQDVQHALSGPQTQNQLALIRDIFEPKKHSMGIELHYISPHSEFYNKEGTFSAKTFDISNCDKVLIDVLFLERHESANYKNIGWDDRYISELHSRKSAGLTHRIEIRIWIIER